MNDDIINNLVNYCQARNVNGITPVQGQMGEECLADYKLLGYNKKEHLLWGIKEDKLITINRRNL